VPLQNDGDYYDTEPAVDLIDMESMKKPSGTLVHPGVSSSAKLNYLMTFPEGFNPDMSAAEKKQWPLIIFLHSLEERGEQLARLVNNPEGQGKGLAGYAIENPSFGFVTLSPLCPKGTYWSFLHRRLHKLIREVLRDEAIDKTRIYISGVSMGGIGTWSMVMAYPDLFAAAAPISGAVYSPPMLPRYGRIHKIPFMVSHDRFDPSIPFKKAEKSVERLQRAGGCIELLVFETGKHYIQEAVFERGDLFDLFADK
jgi:predicted peptidase